MFVCFLGGGGEKLVFRDLGLHVLSERGGGGIEESGVLRAHGFCWDHYSAPSLWIELGASLLQRVLLASKRNEDGSNTQLL